MIRRRIMKTIQFFIYSTIEYTTIKTLFGADGRFSSIIISKCMGQNTYSGERSVKIASFAPF